jgi:multiple sugar transport system permease protein
MDGSGTFRTFFHITLPMLRNVTLICTTLLFIWTFNTISFNNIYLLTKGGPSNATFVMSILSYYTAFFRSKMGYASAITVVMLVVMMIMSVIYLKLQRNND